MGYKTRRDGTRRTVVLGLLGSTLDRGAGPKRWDHWRPTVDLCRHEDLVIDRLELLHEREASTLCRTVTEDITHLSPETTVRTHPYQWRDPWDFEEVYSSLHAFARAYPFDLENEHYLVHITTGTHVAQICLFLLTESRHFPARLLQAHPPERDRSQPGRLTLIDLDLSRYDRLAARFEEERAESLSVLKAGIATRSPTFNRLIEQIERVAMASTAPVLLTGPTGAGKSQLARRIYDLKRARRQIEGPFVEVNCATLRGDTAMSALFGHVKGAFTGAQSDRPGLLRSAHGGLLFLDEIGELRLDEQAMLLRAVEQRSFLPVGSDREVQSDFQLIAGTNRELPEQVQRGLFREDLLCRINLWTFRLPGLVERREDLEPNLDHELLRWTEQTGHRVTIGPEARHDFLRFATSAAARWPGNFRDFNAAVARMATLASSGRITPRGVAEERERLLQSWAPLTTTAPAAAAAVPGAAATDDQRLLEHAFGTGNVPELDTFDRVQLLQVLRTCAGARGLSEAGRRLFAVSRAQKSSHNDADRLRKYLARFGLTFDRVR
jgi:transcriptional regulatory protein RtcR